MKTTPYTLSRNQVRGCSGNMLESTKQRTMKGKAETPWVPASYLIIRLQFLPFEVPLHWDILIRELTVKGGRLPCSYRDILQRPQKSNDPCFARGKRVPCVTHSAIPQEQIDLVLHVHGCFLQEGKSRNTGCCFSSHVYVALRC